MSTAVIAAPTAPFTFPSIPITNPLMAFTFLPTDIAFFCADHDSSEKRPKQAATLQQCNGCAIQLQTNHNRVMLCPSCSNTRGLCMICGAPASCISEGVSKSNNNTGCSVMVGVPAENPSSNIHTQLEVADFNADEGASVLLCAATESKPTFANTNQETPRAARALIHETKAAVLANSGPIATFPDPKPNEVMLEDPRNNERHIGVIGFCFREKTLECNELCGSAFLGNYWDLGDDGIKLVVKSTARCFKNAEAAFCALGFWSQADKFADLTGEQALQLQKELQGEHEDDEPYGGFGNVLLGMQAVLHAKFTQNSQCYHALMMTGDAYLLEYNGNVGNTNWLGLLLMLIRDKMRESTHPTWTEYIQESCGIAIESGNAHDNMNSEVWQATVRNATHALVQKLTELGAPPERPVDRENPALEPPSFPPMDFPQTENSAAPMNPMVVSGPILNSNTFVFLQKDLACFCQDHDSSEKRRKEDPVLKPCSNCSRQLHSNYSSLAFCPDCSGALGLCMICGVPARRVIGVNSPEKGKSVDARATNDENSTCLDIDCTGGSIEVSHAVIAAASSDPAEDPRSAEMEHQTKVESRHSQSALMQGTTEPESAAGGALFTFPPAVLNVPGTVFGGPSAFHALPKEAACFCPNHNSTEKRQKSEPSLRTCTGCCIQLHTNYTDIVFCPGCSAMTRACMICGAPAAAVDGERPNHVGEEMRNVAGASVVAEVAKFTPCQQVEGATIVATALPSSADAEMQAQMLPPFAQLQPEPWPGATIVAMPQSSPSAMLMTPGGAVVNPNSFIFLDKETAHFCADHDTTEKRPKQEPTSKVCSSCMLQLQTNYCDVTLCPGCSALYGQCMICGAFSTAHTASANGGIEVACTTGQDVPGSDTAQVGGEDNGMHNEVDVHTDLPSACAVNGAHPAANSPVVDPLVVEVKALSKSTTPLGRANVGCMELQCFAGAASTICLLRSQHPSKKL